MSIVSVIKKDLKVYTRHRKTLLLIFIAPILIMILIGSVFSGTPDKGLKEVRLGVGGGSELGEEIIRELGSSAMFIIVKENTTDPAVIREGVRKGKYRAGIFIPKEEGSTVKLYIDNSRVQIAPVISTVFLTLTEKISFELTLGFISKLWENLGQMESELAPLKEGVILINSSITDLNSDTRDVLASLNAINASGMNASMRKMEDTMDHMSIDLNRTASNINVTRKEISDLDKNVSSIYNNSAELRDELRVLMDNIDSTDAALLDLKMNLQETYNVTCTGSPSRGPCRTLANTIRQVENTRDQMLGRTAGIRSLYGHLDTVARTSGELHEKLNQTDSRLQNMEEAIGNYTVEITNIQGNITNFRTAIVILEDVREKSTGTSSRMGNLTGEMANSTAGLISDIDRAKGVLKEVITKSPTAIAAPVRLERESVFKDRSYLDFLMPGIVSIVLMFISFLLASITIVQERSKKTLIRTLLTPLSLEEFIFAKTFALILIALLQGIILIIVAFLFYGVVIPLDQWGQLFLVILVYSASFIGIGMAVATFSESENTAMLSSLVLGIPMLFLSGVFFPFETMPQLMVTLGSALPVTMGIRAFDSVLVYGEGFDVLAGDLIPLLGYGIAGLGLAYLLLRREVTD